jgi:hypothetical protein
MQAGLAGGSGCLYMLTHSLTCGACCSADGRGQQSCSSQQKTLQAAGPQALTLGPQGRAAVMPRRTLCSWARPGRQWGGGHASSASEAAGQDAHTAAPLQQWERSGQAGAASAPSSSSNVQQRCGCVQPADQRAPSLRPAAGSSSGWRGGGSTLTAQRSTHLRSCCNPLGRLFARGNVARMPGLLMKGGRGRARCGCMGGRRVGGSGGGRCGHCRLICSRTHSGHSMAMAAMLAVVLTVADPHRRSVA